MTDSSFSVRQVGDEAAVRVVGRATAAFGPALRQFLLAAPSRGVRSLAVDLGQCVYLDSTFIGILAMMAVESRETAVCLRLANAGPVPRRHLASLGVEGLFSYVDAPLADGPWEALGGSGCVTSSGGLHALGRTVLEAHEALGAMNPDNVPRFRDAVESLRREVQRGRP